ncbi:RnfABCDGE type electron transport complex subunit D [Pseudomonas aeruginosa]
MALPRPTSPHARGSNRTPAIMRLVLGACVPGLLTLTWLYGPGTLLNLAWASLVALACEAAMLALRKRPPGCSSRTAARWSPPCCWQSPCRPTPPGG